MKLNKMTTTIIRYIGEFGEKLQRTEWDAELEISLDEFATGKYKAGNVADFHLNGRLYYGLTIYRYNYNPANKYATVDVKGARVDIYTDDGGI